MKMALYRKYRSKRFEDVIGQQAAAQALRNQIKSGRIGHSYIFTGIRGTGKTSFARILAKAVNCPNTKDGEPCGECDICRGIDDGSILDVTEIDAASNSGVDNIRDLRDETAYAPSVCKMRVYIIDEVHMLTKEAFNALLKIMEEPPAHVLFILATTEIQKVPATILSRCQRFDLRRISREDIAAHLLHIASLEKIDLTDGGAALIARLSDGAMRDALSLLDTCASLGETVDEQTVARLTGLANKEYLFELAENIRAKDIAAIFVKLGELYENSLDAARLCTELLRHFRNLLMVRLSGQKVLSDCSAEDAGRYAQQAEGFASAELLRVLRELSATADKLGNSADKMLLMELCFLKLCDTEAAVSVPARPATAARPAGPAPTAPAPAGEAPPWQESAPTRSAPEPAPTPQKAPAPPAAAPKAAAEAGQSDAPAAVQPRPAEGEAAEISGWDGVVAAMQSRNGLLHAFLSGSKGYLTQSHVLIDGSPMFLKYMRDHPESKDALKDAIREAVGIDLPIGPYTPGKMVVRAAQPAPAPAAPTASAAPAPAAPAVPAADETEQSQTIPAAAPAPADPDADADVPPETNPFPADEDAPPAREESLEDLIARAKKNGIKVEIRE